MRTISVLFFLTMLIACAQPSAPAALVPTNLPTATVVPTTTATIRPTQKPTIAPTRVPTVTTIPTEIPTKQPTAMPTIVPVPIIGTVVADGWEVQFLGAESVARDNNRQAVVLNVRVINHASADMFIGLGVLALKDTQGRIYEDDSDLADTLYPQFVDKWDVDRSSGMHMNPDATAHVIVVYDAPITMRTFTLHPSVLISNWKGNVTFTLP